METARSTSTRLDRALADEKEARRAAEEARDRAATAGDARAEEAAEAR